MEKLVSVRELFKQKEKYLNTQISVGGWVRSIRDSKTFGFIVLNDGTFFEPLQIVYSDKLNNFEKISISLFVSLKYSTLSNKLSAC